MHSAHQPTDPIAPTVPAPALHPPPHPAAVVGFATAAPPSPRGWVAGAVGVGVGFALGVLVGLLAGGDDEPATGSEPAAAVADVGELAVGSEPAGGVVLVDGRVVGLTPVPRLELAPGDHSIVIDLFGYQPYLGVLTIEAGAKAGLDAHLAALNDESGQTTRGDYRGGIKVVTRQVPRSALAPAAPAAATAPAAEKRSRAKRSRRRAPEPPRRNCRNEEFQCKRDCDSARTSCEMDCPGCGSCNTSDGWDKCRQMCSSCKQGCKSNLTFCKSRCESARRQCSR